MIFITVGTTHFPFVRMAKLVSKLLHYKKSKEKIIFQHGSTRVRFSSHRLRLYSYLSYPQINSFLRQARVVVSHGGPATIYQTLSLGKKPFVLPREKKYAEHVSDHQVCFCDFLSQRGLVEMMLENTRVLPLSLSLPTRKTIKDKADTALILYLEALSL